MEVEGCGAADRRVRWPVHALFLLGCVQGLDCCDPVHSERDRFFFSLLTSQRLDPVGLWVSLLVKLNLASMPYPNHNPNPNQFVYLKLIES